MKVTLQINGREKCFSEEELVSKLEELEKLMAKVEELQGAISNLYIRVRPQQNKWFEVDTSSIGQKLFEEERGDSKQEKTRKLILEAFEEVKSNPERYSKFKTLMPEKTWQGKTVGEMKDMANQNGCHIANWVEQALEWAQRIQNGEPWENLCNIPDTANRFRLIIWKSGKVRCVGGADIRSATTVDHFDRRDKDFAEYAVPLIVLSE